MKSISRNWRGIEKITIELITAYLLAHGWQRVEYRGNGLIVFRSDDDNLFTLPARETQSDFYSRMMESIDRIAEIEDEATYVVLQRFAHQSQEQDR